jgi:transmembrane sensor
LSLALAASLLLAIGVAFVAWRYGGHDTDPNTYQTQAAQVRTYALQDGTQLTLGPDSYAFARHTPAVREVVLIQGQVFVRVAKDPTRPFRVLAADKAITALGTAFDARLDGNVLKVAVTEGKVSIAAAARGPAPVLLGAGEQTVARIDGPIAAPSLSKTKDPTAWRKGQLQYIDEALADVIADVNRYTSEKIVLTQPQLRDRLYTGTVYRDRIDEWVKALEEVFPLQAQKREGRILLQQKEP